MSSLALHTERIRRRDLRKVIREGFEVALEKLESQEMTSRTSRAPAKASWWISAVAIFTE